MLRITQVSDTGASPEAAANVVANIFINYINHVAGTDIDFPVRSTRTA
ncbi:MAG TPA: hypothetical protein PKW21_03040 [Rhabdaerophilum sp.]|nr:hypothetical protein [Rhabdaerophilum sp.]